MRLLLHTEEANLPISPGCFQEPQLILFAYHELQDQSARAP